MDQNNLVRNFLVQWSLQFTAIRYDVSSCICRDILVSVKVKLSDYIKVKQIFNVSTCCFKLGRYYLHIHSLFTNRKSRYLTYRGILHVEVGRYLTCGGTITFCRNLSILCRLTFITSIRHLLKICFVDYLLPSNIKILRIYLIC